MKNKSQNLNDNLPEILCITSYPPRECGIATYSQDLIYSEEPKLMELQDLRFMLKRKCKALRSKLENNLTPGYQSRWQNQLDLYESILKHLPLQ
jgi:hypothetical protein